MPTPPPVTTLVPVATLLEWLDITDEDNSEQERAVLCLETARHTIDRLCSREFVSADENRVEDRYFRIEYSEKDIEVDDFQEVNSVEYMGIFQRDFTTLADTNYRTDRLAHNRPLRRIIRTDGMYFPQGEVKVNAKWGIVLPPDGELAILQEAAYLFQTNKAPGGVYITADGQEVEELMARNPALYSVVDNYKLPVIA